jgi:hypothetical protein
MQKLPYNHWVLFILWQSGHKRRFKIACKEWKLTREQIIEILK